MNLQPELLPDGMQAFLSFLQSRGRKPSTLKRYEYDLADFHRFIDVVLDGEEAAVKPDDITTYFHILAEERHYQLRTLKRIQTVLVRYFRFLRDTKRIASNPMAELPVDDSVWNVLKEEELIAPKEMKRLMDTLESDSGLSDKQQAVRPMLAPRNIVILKLFYDYGLRMHELASIRIEHLHLTRGELDITEGNPRTLQLTKELQKQLYYYLDVIPQAVRPSFDGEPLFVAFDFQRQTYRWSYENDQPKNLTEVAIQKMIREERKRAGIERAISATHFRNSYIVRELESGVSPEALMDRLGLQSMLTLTKYIRYVNEKAAG